MMRRMAMVMMGTVLIPMGLRMGLAERHSKKAEVKSDVRLEGDHLERTVHCHGGALHVLGNDSRLTVEGSCTTVYVEGSRNWIEVQDADVIQTSGRMNSVMYLSPNTRTVDPGRANTVAPKWQQ